MSRRKLDARRAWAAALFAALLAQTGCTAIGGTTPPSRFYLLEALASPPPRTDGPGLGVGPIRLAKYLDRPQIVRRKGEHALSLGEFDRWGEPLAESITRVVMANLGSALGTDRAQRHPWRDPRAVDVQVELDVQRFDGPAGGPVELVAHWRVRRGGAVVERVARIAESPSGSSYEAQAAAMSRALATLCDQIAAAIPAS